ncbi:MAG: hypothetical protein IPK48_07630 [Gammaproteobacteria bacterium]|nr:hypothetical protein [Gammaproteobacteria bacterium]
MASLASDGERNVFSVYYRAFKDLGDKLPALTPQVYLHYDPYTLAQRGGVGRLSRQRMDFLLLFSDTGRVVVEVDGSQHFAEDGKLSLARYAEMVAADRDLRLAGYEVYRFGANELTGHGSADRQIVRSSDRQIVRSSDRQIVRSEESFFPATAAEARDPARGLGQISEVASRSRIADADSIPQAGIELAPFLSFL